MTPEQIAAARSYLSGLGIIPEDADDAAVEAAAQRYQREALAAVNAERADSSATSRPLNFAPQTIDREARTVEVTLATERPVPMMDYRLWEVVDEILPMSGYNATGVRGNRIPMLDSHMRRSVGNILGSMTSLRVENAQLVALAQFSSTRRTAFTLAEEGHLDGISVGYRIDQAVYVEPGDSVEVNGRTYENTGERMLKVATRWTPVEGSLCAIGADPDCGTRSQSNEPRNNTNPTNPTNPTPPHQEPTMNREEIIALLEGRGYSRTAAEHWADHILSLDEGVRQSTLEALPAITQTAATPPAPQPIAPPAPAAPAQTRTAGPTVEEERARCAELQGLLPELRRGFPHMDNLQELINTAVRDGQSVEQLRNAVTQAHCSTQQPIRVVRDEHENTREAIECALLTRANVPGERSDRELTIGREFGNYSLLRLAEHALERNGVSARGMDPMDLVGRALTLGTGDFSNALANTANKSLLAYYQAAQTTWRSYCDVANLNDFKSSSLVAFSHAGYIPEVPELSPIPQSSHSDKAETIQAKSYSMIFGISRQAIVNDDMNVFSRTPAAHAAAWARTLNRLAVNVLLANAALSDSVALYHASHSNLDASTAAISSKATAQAVIRSLKKLLQRQKDLDGSSVLSLMPSVILATPKNEDWLSNAIFETGRADENSAEDIRRLNLSLVCEPELENSVTWKGTTYTGDQDLTFAFANPMVAPSLVMGFVGGNDAPRLETKAGWSVDGTEFKVTGDAVAGVADFRGTAKHDGSP